MLITGLLVLGLALNIFVNSEGEFISKAKEQMEQGYTWEYVGPTTWSKEKSPSTLLQNEGFEPFVLFVLKKPEEEEEEGH